MPNRADFPNLWGQEKPDLEDVPEWGAKRLGVGPLRLEVRRSTREPAQALMDCTPIRFTPLGHICYVRLLPSCP